MIPPKFDKYGTPVTAGSTVIIDLHLPDVGIAQFERIKVKVFETSKGLAYERNNDVHWLMDIGSKLWYVETPHPTCATCKHLGRNTPFSIYEGCNKREAQNGGRLKGLRLLDPTKDYCSNHEPITNP